jgi:hypothetical protein
MTNRISLSVNQVRGNADRYVQSNSLPDPQIAQSQNAATLTQNVMTDSVANGSQAIVTLPSPLGGQSNTPPSEAVHPSEAVPDDEAYPEARTRQEALARCANPNGGQPFDTRIRSQTKRGCVPSSGGPSNNLFGTVGRQTSVTKKTNVTTNNSFSNLLFYGSLVGLVGLIATG